MAGSKLLCLLILLSACFAAIVASQTTGCVVPIGNKQLYRHKWPLVFTTEAQLLGVSAANSAQLIIPAESEVLLSCGPNYFQRYYKQEVLHVKCNGDTGNFSLVAANTLKNLDADVELSITDLTCDLRVIEEILAPVKGCIEDKCTATRFGYVQPIELITIVLGEACYDETQGRTLFAHIQLGHTEEANYLDKQNKRYLTAQRHPNGRYKIELFRDLHFDEIYENIRTQLHVKLAPNLKLHNFIDEKLLSNAQLQPVKKLGWNYFVGHDELQQVLDILKADIRTLSGKQNLHIYVGSHGVAVLRGANRDEQMQLYLQHNKRFPMPDLLWMLVQHEQKAIAFVVYNRATNALHDNEENREVICESICDKVSWLSAELKTNNKQVICCAYEDLKQFVSEVPQLEHVNEKFL